MDNHSNQTPTKQAEKKPEHIKFGMIASFRYAIDGILRTICSQRNMKVHWVSGLAVMLVGMALPLELASRATLLFCVFMVVAMEILNTALESFVDLHVKQYETNAMIAKDAAAAAVLVFAAGAVIIFSDVLIHRWDIVTRNPEAVWRTVIWGIPILFCVAAIVLTPRNIVLLTLLLIIATTLVLYLAFHSRDEVFSLGAFSFILLSFIARMREPKLLPEEPPRTG